MAFNESKLEEVVIGLLQEQGYGHVKGEDLNLPPGEVLIKEDLQRYLAFRYGDQNITDSEINRAIQTLQNPPASDLYESNKSIMQMVSDGFLLTRDDTSQEALYIELIDYKTLPKRESPKPDQPGTIVAERKATSFNITHNIYKIVNQLEIQGTERRIPDAILYINGIPLVVFEFKSAIREEATIYDAYIQLTRRYRRDIPELFKYNAFCVISDGVNSKAGSLFSDYEFFYAWRKISGDETEDMQGFDSLYSMIQGMFNEYRLRDIIRNFIHFPDKSNGEDKIVCRYPQYYAAVKLYDSIKQNLHPKGSGKGGTYFGTTGCGKSYTMLFLTRLLMKSIDLSNPTIVLITDRTDLDDQLSGQFTNAKKFIGDQNIISAESRDHLAELLRGKQSGGVFLTTIQKFTESTGLLTERNNVICISDEAHRTQTNIEPGITITDKEVIKKYSFAKHLRESLPNATYVGFTGTPVDATLDVFGPVVEAYTMNESVEDEITVGITYEGRAAKVLLDNEKLKEIEDYYAKCAEQGTTEHQIEESKKATARMDVILGDPGRIKAIAEDFVEHYQNRIDEGATVKEKAMFVCANRNIAYDFYQQVIKLKPEWAEAKISEDESRLSQQEKNEMKSMARINMVMTRNQDDPKALYELIGSKGDRQELDRQFKNEKSNFKIAIVVDMWLTGFDVPFLDTIYIDKPIQKHNLIQAISRVNRRFENKQKGLVVDYIGIKRQMDNAMAQYSAADKENIEEIEKSIAAVKDTLDLLNQMLHRFDKSPYFDGNPQQQLECLREASEFVKTTDESEKRFMKLVKRLKIAYDICCGSQAFTQEEKDYIYFYVAVRSIIAKITKGDAADISQMNTKVRQMIQDALLSDGVEEVFSMMKNNVINLFDDKYIEKILNIKQPNTKFIMLQHLLEKSIGEFQKINKMQALNFSEKLKNLLDKYNDRRESEVLDELTDEIVELYYNLKNEQTSFQDLGISIEEKSFYDILKTLAEKYGFEYPDEKLIPLSKEVKKIVNEKSKYTDWNRQQNIKDELKADLIVALRGNNYPPVAHNEVYKEVFEQAENFKKYQGN